MMNADGFPTTFDAITPRWLAAMLRHSGALPAGEVTGVQVQPFGEGAGILSHLARLTLTYDRPVAAPRTLIAKVPTVNPGNLRLAQGGRAYAHETSFYRELAAGSPLPAPRCFASLYDQERDAFLLLLEDLGAARTVDQLAGCSPEDAALVEAALGALHRAWWERPAAPGLSWLRSFADPPALSNTAAFFRRAWATFSERYGEQIPGEARALGPRLVEQIDRVIARVAAMPATLCHGDLRLDNLFFVDDERPVVAIDWQFCVRAGGLMDVALFLIYNLRVDVRRAHERELLRRYWQTLQDGGVTDYRLERCLDDYRWCVLYWMRRPLAAALADPGNARGEELFASFRERCFAANLDWDTAALLTT